MVEKISVNPESVRCLGNIVSPKVLREFHEYLSNTVNGTDTVDGRSMTIYTSEYKAGSTLALEYSSWIGASASSFTVKCTLKNSSNSAINGGMVYLEVNDTLLTGTTNSSGVYTFTVPTDGSQKYRFIAYYNGTSSLAGCWVNGVAHSKTPDNIQVVSTKTSVNIGDTCNLFATVTDENNSPVQGAIVEFYTGE